MSTPPQVYKVALFGVTGSGKSSVINLLAEKQVANVTTGVESCTRRAQWHPISLGEKQYRLWDTMGFNQAEAKDMNPLSPYEQAHTLLRNLQDGVDLILLCARKDGINASLRNLYWLLNSFFFRGHVPIVLVLTHFDTLHERWWERNKSIIAHKCGIPQTIPHACITTIRDHGLPQSDSMYNQSKQALKALLQQYATNPIPLRLDLASNTGAAESLNTYCQLSIPDATTLVEKFGLPKRPFQAILFGETGVGKSSIINLLDGRPVAEISSGLVSCTLDSRSYKINTGLHQFLVWDTIGLNGIYMGYNVFERAAGNAVRLIRTLRNQGGIDVLVFCKKEGRLTATELSNFKLFYEFFCEKQTPVAFIVTHLEFEDPMEKWWEVNGEVLLSNCQVKNNEVVGHACITARDDPKLHDKLSLSRLSVQTMLEDSITSSSAFNRDEGSWVMSFLRRLLEMVRVVNLPAKRNIVKNLMDHCELNQKQAEELARLLHSPG